MSDDDRTAEELERHRRRRAIDEARATVRRLQIQEIERRRREEVAQLPPAEVARRLIPAAGDDAVARWKADANRATAMREHEREEIASKPRPFDWRAFDERIEAAIEQERTLLAEVFGAEVAKLLAEERAATRAEVDAMRDVCLKFVDDVVEIFSDRGAKVVDLPALPLRSRSVN